MKKCTKCGHREDEMSEVEDVELEVYAEDDENEALTAKDEILAELMEELSDNIAEKLRKKG